jgi:hypothetical protein
MAVWDTQHFHSIDAAGQVTSLPKAQLLPLPTAKLTWSVCVYMHACAHAKCHWMIAALMSQVVRYSVDIPSSLSYISSRYAFMLTTLVYNQHSGVLSITGL